MKRGTKTLIKRVSAIINKYLKSRLISNTGTYTVFKVFDSLIPFFLLPIITRILRPDEYGVFVLFQALVGIALPLMTLSVDSSILLNYFKVKESDFKSYFSSGYVLIILSSLLFFLIIIFFKIPIAAMTTFPSEWIISILILCFFQIHSNLALNMFQVKQAPHKYGVYSILLTAAKNALTLFFVIVLGLKWQGIILGNLIAYSLFFFVSIYLFSRNGLFSRQISKEFLIDNIKVGLPLSLHVLGSWLASSATRIIIGGLLGVAATGSFGIGATIGLIVLFTQDSFNKAFVPYLFENLNDFNKNTELKLIRLTYVYNASLFLFAACIGLFGYFFIDVIFGSAYSHGKEVALLISIAYAFDGMYKMHVNYIFFMKKTHIIFLITMTSGLLNIGFSYYFIKMFGLMGGALSLCVINFVSYLLSWYIGNKVFPMKWFSFATKYS